MKAILQTAKERGGIEVGDVEKPEPDADEILVRVHSAGLCGSDAHAYKFVSGYEWVEVPRVMGHEYAGEVAEVGADVDSFEPGDVVVERPIHECGHCYQCEHDDYNVCANFEVTGLHYDGAYREYTTVPADFATKVPESIPLEHAAITEPTSIAARAVLDQSDVTAGDRVLVEGPGPIGMLTATIADNIGADVVVSGLTQDTKYRLPLAEDLGLETIDSQANDLEEFTDEYTDEVGFDVVFDTTGHHTGVEMASDNVRRGGQIVVVGIPADTSEVSMTPLVRGEVEVNTSYGSKLRNFQQAIRLMEENVIDTELLIDTSYSVDEPKEAFEDFLEAETLKPVFRFWD